MMIKQVGLILVTAVLQWAFLPVFKRSFSAFPHFRTPLNDLRELREMFYTYETKANFYHNTFQIGQSEILLIALYKLSSFIDLRIILAIASMVSTGVQLAIIDRSISKNKDVALIWVVINPIALFGGGIQNIGSINDAIFYLIIYLIQNGELFGFSRVVPVVAAIATYFDPRILFIVFPLTVFQKRLQGESKIWGAVAGQAVAIVAIWFSVASAAQIKNATDMLMVNNPQENIGPFWYIMLEMFKQLLQFLKLMYLLMQALMCAFITMHVHKTFDVLELLQPIQKQAQSDQRMKLFQNGVLLVCLVKQVMNAYPCLHDLSITVFFVIINWSFVSKQVDLLFLFIGATIYAILNMGLLWTTWLQRFSGNANFFYFQTIAFNIFFILFFIQFYIAVDTKRKKYAKRITF